MDSEPPPEKTISKEKTKASHKKTSSKKPPPRSPMPEVVSLFFNLLIATGLTGLLIRKEWTTSPCIPLTVNVVFVPLVLTFFLQLVWRYLGGAIKVGRGVVRSPWLRISLDAVFAVLDDLHFARWPAWVLWVATGATVAVTLHFLGPLSLFRERELPPVVDGFQVSRDGTDLLLSPDDAAEARSGEALKISARIRGPGGEHCTWFVDRGQFSAVHDCTVIYVAPLDGTFDNLSVRVQSACQTQNSFTGLTIQLISDQL